MSQRTDLERKLYLLRCFNPNVVTKSTAEDGKWAADSIELLLEYIAVCPAREYWKGLVLKDARVRPLLGGLFK